MKKLFILFIAVAGFAVSSNAQVNATATSTATIITPIGITKDVNMNFGNVAVSTGGGTVVLTPGSVRSVGSGDVTLTTPIKGTVTAASFTVTGAVGYTYAITLPLTATTLSLEGNFDMTVDGWSSTPSSTGTFNTASETLLVGGTLHVGASQGAGMYVSSTPFTVTVNYN